MVQAITGVADWMLTLSVGVAVPVCSAAVSWGGLKWLGGGSGGRQTDEGRAMVIRYTAGFLLCLAAKVVVGELRTATGL